MEHAGAEWGPLPEGKHPCTRTGDDTQLVGEHLRYAAVVLVRQKGDWCAPGDTEVVRGDELYVTARARHLMDSVIDCCDSLCDTRPLRLSPQGLSL